nr:hypothetical protein [Bacilli bacterium]
DIDSMIEIKELVNFDDYTEIKTKFDNDCEVYYISKFRNDNGYSLFIEPAVYKGELLEQDSNLILVMDWIEEDYKLNGEYEEVEFLWLDEECNDCDCEEDYCLDDSEKEELRLIIDCAEFVLDTQCPDCVMGSIFDLAYKFKNIGFTDHKDLIREVNESLD